MESEISYQSSFKIKDVFGRFTEVQTSCAVVQQLFHGFTPDIDGSFQIVSIGED